MEFPFESIERDLGLTEAQIREAMEEQEVEQFSNDERRVEFQLVPVSLTDGAALYLAADMKLVAVTEGASENQRLALFMRAAPSRDESETMLFEKALNKLLLDKQNSEIEAEAPEAEEEESNVVNLFKAMRDSDD